MLFFFDNQVCNTAPGIDFRSNNLQPLELLMRTELFEMQRRVCAGVLILIAAIFYWSV